MGTESQREEYSFPSEDRGIIVAEYIAMFRAVLQYQMLRTDLKPQGWREMYHTTLEQYPQIFAYRGLFDYAFGCVQAANNDLESLWRRRVGPRTEPEAGENVNLEKTDGSFARILFRDIFEFYPTGNPQAIKGLITLRFMVDDTDFQSLLKKYPDTKDSRAFNLRDKRFRFSNLVLNKEDGPKHDLYDIHHELEHGINAILASSRQDSVLDDERLNIPQTIADKIKRRESKAFSMEQSGKDELLARFTLVEFIHPEIPIHEVFDWCDRHCKALIYILTDKIQIYFPKFAQQARNEEEQKRYVKSVEAGNRAFIELFKVYTEGGYVYELAARMSINVLEQFPLADWPVVVRLIKRRQIP